MIQTLLKKQFLELTAGIRIGRARDGLRKRGTLFFLFLLFGYLFVLLFAMFGFFAKSIVTALYDQGLDWLYFSVMGIAAASVGSFCTVLTTATNLFRARDNEILLSLPVSYKQIIFVRMLGIYLANLLIMGIVFIPAIFVYLGASHKYSLFLFDVLTFLLLGLLVLGVNCLLGWFISLFSSRIRHKSLFSLLLSFAFLGTYYLFYSHLEQIIASILSDSESLGNSLRNIAYPFYVLGLSGCGETAGLLQFSAFVILLLFPAWHLVKQSFFRFTNSQNERLTFSGAQPVAVTARSQTAALLRREWKRFSASSDYILSCGLGLVITVAMGCGLLLKPDMAETLALSLETLFPNINAKSAVVIGSVAGLCLSLCNIAAVSVSLEGNRLWILKSLPVKSGKILCTKADFQFFLCLPAGVFLLTVFYLTIDMLWVEYLLSAFYVLLFTRFLSYMNVIWNILFPNLTWINEVIPLKRSISVFISLLGGILAALLPLLIYAGFSPYADQSILTAALLALFAAACLAARRWLRGKGASLWEEL